MPTTPQAAVDRALAHASASITEATRALFEDLFESHQLGNDAGNALSAIAERAVAIHLGTAPASGGQPAEALGDNWFQCPHCSEVFEGETPACKACNRALAAARRALVIDLGGATAWLCPSSGDAYPRGALVGRVEWMRVECDGRWFELLDEAGRAEAERRLPAGALPPNVAAVALRDGDRTLLVHPTKLEAHVVDATGARTALGKATATELAVRELTEFLYPEAPPETPSGKAIAGKGHARNLQLEAMIEADLERTEPFLVYADWLQAQGDPRGELIALQHANKVVEADRLLAKHAHHFYGRLSTARQMLDYDEGGLGRATRWRCGYLDRLWISNTRDGEAGLSVPEALGALLDHPSCRFLRELTVGIVDYEDNEYGEIANVIGARDLPTLETLTLGDFYSEETELNWSHTGDLSPLYRAVPNLQKLVVRSGSIQLGHVALPSLGSLTVITGGLDLQTLRAICGAPWPKLWELSLQLGREVAFTLEHLAPIFAGTSFPRVTHLGLGNSNQADDIAAALARSAIAPRLVAIDFSHSTLGDEGARALVAGELPALQRVSARNCYLTTAGLEALRTRWTVDADRQRDDGGDPEDRYIGAYE